MSNNNARKKLLKASTEASDKGGVQHVLAIVKADGRFDMSGWDKIVSAILNNVSFYQNLKDILTTSSQDTGNILPVNMLSFPLLPCSPLWCLIPPLLFQTYFASFSFGHL